MNTHLITAVEILRQSDQGYSAIPFIIRADDGYIYFVKGFSKTKPVGLVSEVIAAELGSRIGLPIPEWRYIHIPDELIKFSFLKNACDLSGGIAFASRQVDNARDLLFESVENVDPQLRLLLITFDYWIQNEDRNLSKQGGNVNLLLSDYSTLHVIDHNGAFDTHFSLVNFTNHHVFKDSISDLADLMTQASLKATFAKALDDWQAIIASLPQQWLYHDKEQIDVIEPSLATRLNILTRYTQDSFWGAL